MNSRDREEEFTDWLDELYPTVYVGICEFEPSKVLKLCDEVTYNEWYWYWINELG